MIKGGNTMLEEILKELHDAKLKAVESINNGDMEMADKYIEVIKSLEKSVEMLKESEK